MILRNATLVTLSPARVERTDVRVKGGKIHSRARALRPQQGEEIVDLSGLYVFPGMVNAHTHLYSSLARGMPAPSRAPKNFLEILQKIWWKLDRTLDDEAIYFSALAGAIEAAKCGTTLVVDHHASPGFISGSLEIVRAALEKVGLRGVLCYEVTDRGGRRKRDLGLEENDTFIGSHRKDARFRGIVGAHAAFTLSDASLQACGELADHHETGVHMHVAEDTIDVENGAPGHRGGLTERLSRSGILKEESILAHCIHLRPKDLVKVRTSKPWIVHNPRSNMNNAVGHAPLHLFGTRVALGTDGFPADMFEEGSCGFLRNLEVKPNGAASMFANFLQGGQRMASEIFGERFGTLEDGTVADLTVLEYPAPTKVSRKNLAWHLLFGIRSAMVKSVMVNGKWIVWDRRLVTVDEEEAMEKASAVSMRLWKRMEGR